MKKHIHVFLVLINIFLLSLQEGVVYAQQASSSFSLVDNVGWKNGKDVPGTVTESYSYNPSLDTLSVTVTFDRTGFAAVPPMLALAYTYGFPITFNKPVENTGTHSVFGPLLGFSNTSDYTYTITGLKKYVDGSFIQKQNQDVSALQGKLSEELQKVIQAGHLRPEGFFSKNPGQSTVPQPPQHIMWYNPAEQLYLLSETYSLLPQTSQQLLKSYLANEETNYPAETIYFMPAQEGTPRRYFPIPDNVYTVNQHQDPNDPNITDFEYAYSYLLQKQPGIWNIYGLSRYYALENSIPAANEWTTISNIFTANLQQRDWATMYWTNGNQPAFNAVQGVNQMFAGAIGYIRLARMVTDQDAENQGWEMLGKMAALRYAMGKYTQYQQDAGYFPDPVLDSGYDANDPAWWSKQHQREMLDYSGKYTWMAELVTSSWSTKVDNVRQVHRLDENGVDVWEWYGDRGNQKKEGFPRPQQTDGKFPSYGNNQPRFIPFADITPELGIFLKDYLQLETQAYIDRVEENLPTWELAFSQSILGREMGLSMPYNAHDLFMVYAWVLDKTAEEVESKIDVSWMPKVGDYYYIHKLSEAIKAYNYCWSSDGSTCDNGSVTPPLTPGDTDGDNDVDIFDYNAVITDFGKTGGQGFSAADFDTDGDVDIFDYNVVISNFGT